MSVTFADDRTPAEGAPMNTTRVRCSALRYAAVFGLVTAWSSATARADEFLKVADVEQQPLAAATERLVEALDYIGAPLPAADRDVLFVALKLADAGKSAAAVQKVLDPMCVAGVTINAESRVSVVEGP